MNFWLLSDVCCNLVGFGLHFCLCVKWSLQNNSTSPMAECDVKAACCSFAPEWFILSWFNPVTVFSSRLNMYYFSGCCGIIGFLKCPCRLSCLLAVLKHTICLQSQPKLGNSVPLSFVCPLINHTRIDIHPETLLVLHHSNFHIGVVVIEVAQR